MVNRVQAPTGCGQDNQQTSEATECCSGVPQAGLPPRIVSKANPQDKINCGVLGNAQRVRREGRTPERR